MKQKKEFIVLGLIILALALYLVLRQTDQTQYKLPEISKITKADIDKIEIRSIDKKVTLKMSGDKWQMSPKSYLADQEKVDKMLGTISGLKLTALVSESKNYARYELDDAKKINVKAYDGEKILRSFDIGKQAPSYRHTFVRLNGNYRVYHAEENFKDHFNQSIDELRDKNVMSFKKSEIAELTIKMDNQSFAFIKKVMPVTLKPDEEKKKQPEKPKEEEVWEMSDGTRAKNTELNDLLSELENLKCDNYIEGKSKVDFKNPIYAVIAKGAKSYTLNIFKKDEKQNGEKYPAISSENDYPFLLSTWKAERIMKKVGDLKQEKEEK